MAEESRAAFARRLDDDVEAGLPVDAARELFDRVATAMTEDGVAFLDENGIQAFRDGDPPIWISATAEPSWQNLGAGSGE